jgi:hypothetical protein
VSELTNDPIGVEELGAPAEAPKPKPATQPRDEHGHFAPKDPAAAASKPKGKGKRKPGAAGEVDLDELRAMLIAQTEHMAPLLVLPTAAEVWHARAADAVENLVTLAVRFPSLRAGLETGVVVMAGLGVVNFTSAVAYGAACDLGFADPNSYAAQSLGITDAYYRAHPDAEEDLERGAPDNLGAEPAEGPSANGRGRLPKPSIMGDVPGRSS